MSDKPTTSSRVINRHMARCLTELEDNGYSAECIEIVKRAFCWAREDLGKAERQSANTAEMQAQINAARKSTTWEN